MKTLVIVGTRPEAIKMAPVIAELRKACDTYVCSTGQHREMLAQALGIFSIKPDISLDTMSPGRSLNILASRQLEALDDVLQEYQPDWVLVQGDTTTAFCAGLAAFHRGIKVGHVEAGLRTGDLHSPFPEEANRRLISKIATLHFAPTSSAAKALMAEGIPADRIHVTGNTVVDAVNTVFTSHCHAAPPALLNHLPNLEQEAGSIVLVTCHRRENFGDVMEKICHLLARLAGHYTAHTWVMPVHMNPGVREPVERILGNIPNFKLLEPLDYASNLYLISRACLVVSDSGGIQEEAPTFGTPVVVMREHTERLEGVTAGFATLAGQDPARIEDAVRHWLDKPQARELLLTRHNPYGDGQAAKRIVAALRKLPMDHFHG